MKPTWILGPCSMESRALYRSTGSCISALMSGRDWYYKSSFDKANRTSSLGPRGPGLKAGIDIFQEFKRDYPSIRLLTDVHECHQVEALVGLIDCIQIPAFLCRQTDLLIECAKHFGRINVKKGQWVSPTNILGAADKIRSVNPHAEVWLCERGTQLGYERLIVDFRDVDMFARVFDRVILDCTHSAQLVTPEGRISGDRKLAERYLVSSPIFGYSGVFAEVHPAPSEALSDADCQIPLNRLPALIAGHDATWQLGADQQSCAQGGAGRAEGAQHRLC